MTRLPARLACTVATALTLLAQPALAQSAPQAASACVPQKQAASVFVALTPDLLRGLAAKCVAVLPPDATLREPDAQLTHRYDAAASAAWPDALGVVKRLVPAQIGDLLTPQTARSLSASILVPLFIQKVPTGDCGQIDHIVTLLTPLPPTSLGQLFANLYGLAQDGADAARAAGADVPPPLLRICTPNEG